MASVSMNDNCETCSHKNVCKYDSKVQSLLKAIESVAEGSTPIVNVNVECTNFQHAVGNIKGGKVYRGIDLGGGMKSV